MSKHRFFRLSSNLLCAAGFDGQFQRVNPAFSRTLGHPEEELLSASLLEYVHPDDLAETRAHLEQLCRGTETQQFRNRYRCKDGSYKWLAWTATPYPEDELIYAAARDTTREKLAEEELRQYNIALELTNERLEQLSEEAEAATRAKSEFLANISHELRTPMAAILSHSDLLLQRLSRHEDVETLNTIKRNGDYLLELINDILDLSKIEAGKLDVERIPCSPDQMLSDVASLMRVRADEKRLPLEIHYETPIPETIQSDPTRLRQILINLVGNAIKFTEQGSVRLVARLLPASRGSAGNASNSPLLCIDVVDTGVGISKEKAARLFQPFTQADSSTTREFGGSGLGLTISKRLAEILGGTITVATEPGHGSTFTLQVATGPLNGVRRIARPKEPTTAQHSSDNGQAANGGGTQDARASSPLRCRVLLAEDYPDMQLPVAFTLRNAGAEVEIAENGALAIEKVHAAEDEGLPFEVILMDMQMPVVDGYTATRRLRDQGYQGAVIALTAHAMNGDREKCIAAGCNEYMTKPLHLERLVELVSEFSASGEEAWQPLTSGSQDQEDAYLASSLTGDLVKPR